MRRGFILGKFMPPHEGHLMLCQSAARLVDELTVLVCSTPSEPISGYLRFQWMTELLPKARIIHMHRDIPQEPEDHPDFWDIWREAVREHHPEPIDKVFGSESYVIRLAEELNAQPVVLDPARRARHISARMIRQNPALHWDLIPGPMRPYYQKHICLMGPESTGKTTLADNLAAYFGGPVVPEYGRTYDEVYRPGDGWMPEMLSDIAEVHLAVRDTLRQSAGPLLIEDTDPVITCVWSRHLTGEVPEKLDRLTTDMAKPDLYLLLTPEVGWVDDGTRYWPDQDKRESFFADCEAELKTRNLTYQIIGGSDYAARTEAAMNAAKRLMES